MAVLVGKAHPGPSARSRASPYRGCSQSPTMPPRSDTRMGRTHCRPPGVSYRIQSGGPISSGVPGRRPFEGPQNASRTGQRSIEDSSTEVPPIGRELPRGAVRAQFARLALRRLMGQTRPGPIDLRCPRGTLHVHKNPWRLYEEIFLQECYRPLIPLQQAPRILDIGANIGLASLYFLWRWPAARIEAWEPNPAAYELLGRNVETSRFPEATIQLRQAALSMADGAVDFQVPSKDPAAVYARIQHNSDPGASAPASVSVPSLDAKTVFEEPAALVKLDIEGHEYEVLDHALPTASIVPALMIEFHRVEHHRDRFLHHVTRLTEEGGYWMTDGAGAPMSSRDLEGLKGSLVLRFFRDAR